MDNLIVGVFTIILCSFGYFFSWKYQKQNNFQIAVFLLIICGLILWIYTSSDFFLHEWDERYHALVAKNLIHHPLTPTLYENAILPYDYFNWTGNHIWVHKQPLPLWTLAVSLWMFGINEIAVRLPSILLSTLGIWLSFKISSYFFNKKIAYITAFLFSINGLIIELSAGRVATDHIDIFFMFFVELAIYFSIAFVRKGKMFYNILVGLSLGAAILSKWLPGFIVLPVWLLIIIASGKFKPKTIGIQFLIVFITSILVFLPWQLYIFHTFPIEANWESSFNLKHITEGLDGNGKPFYYFLNSMRINYGELIYLPLLWFFWKTITNLKNYNRLAIAIWFLVPLLFFSFAKTKMQAYILFTSPALFMMTAECWYMVSDFKRNRSYKWFFNLILFLLIALPIRYTIERTKPFEIADRNPNWVTALKQLNERNIKNGILLNYNRPIEAMFYTNLTAYPNIPDKETITKLISNGYTIIINNNENIPSDIKEIKEIVMVSLPNTAK